jgi:hypothetical protein
MVQGRIRIALLPLVMGVAALASFAGCGDDGPVDPAPQNPQHIGVQYLLVAFDGSVPDLGATRTKGAADSLADSLFAVARAGADFQALMNAWSDAPRRDTMQIANYGVTPAPGEFRRAQLQPNFGDAAFALEPDSIGLSEWDSVRAPSGWYVVRRVN